MVHMLHFFSYIFVACFVACLSSYAYAVPTSVQGKFVAAHWMVSGVAVDYKKHIQLAQANGVDAFALNFGGWNLETYREVWLKSIADIFAAAQSLKSNFRVSFTHLNLLQNRRNQSNICAEFRRNRIRFPT
jgi:hypothetical protein